MSEIRQEFAALRDLLLSEQVLNVSSKELRIFLKERKPKDVKEMAELAQQYLEVHGKLYQNWAEQRGDNKKRDAHKRKEGFDKSKSNAEKSSQDGKSDDKKEKTCFICNRTGHFANSCKMRSSGDSKKVTSMHAVTSLAEGGPYLVLDNGWKIPVQTEDKVKMKSALCLDQDKLLPHVTGRFGKEARLVSVLRDTGSNGVIVKSDLVGEENHTGKTGTCTFVDGTQIEVPIVDIYIDSPFYKGEVKALAMRSPFFDVIVGNIPEARDASDPDPHWMLHGPGEGRSHKVGAREEVTCRTDVGCIGDCRSSFDSRDGIVVDNECDGASVSVGDGGKGSSGRRASASSVVEIERVVGACPSPQSQICAVNLVENAVSKHVEVSVVCGCSTSLNAVEESRKGISENSFNTVERRGSFSLNAAGVNNSVECLDSLILDADSTCKKGVSERVGVSAEQEGSLYLCNFVPGNSDEIDISSHVGISGQVCALSLDRQNSRDCHVGLENSVVEQASSGVESTGNSNFSANVVTWAQAKRNVGLKPLRVIGVDLLKVDRPRLKNTC